MKSHAIVLKLDLGDLGAIPPNTLLRENHMTEILLLITKYLMTLYVLILVPIYWKQYGWSNFLWLSDIGLLLTLLALWLNSPLLISIAAVSILPLELLWILDYSYQLTTKHKFIGMTEYMFSHDQSLFVRGLSLFHIIQPAIWIWCLHLWGYDNNAFIYAIILIGVTLLISYFISEPKKNINWVNIAPSWQWIIIFFMAYILLIIWPMDIVLTHLFQ